MSNYFPSLRQPYDEFIIRADIPLCATKPVHINLKLRVHRIQIIKSRSLSKFLCFNNSNKRTAGSDIRLFSLIDEKGLIVESMHGRNDSLVTGSI